MSVAVLVKIPPRLAVARATAIDVVLFAIMAAVCEMFIGHMESKTEGRTCDSISGLKPVEFEGRSEFAYQFPQLTVGIRRDVSSLVELR
jgi:hypothetical protein